MTRMRTKLGLAALVALVLAASAAAYLSTSGSGAGSASASAGADAVTLSPGTPAVELYPGGSSDVAVSLTNPNSSEVNVTSLALDTAQGTGGFAVDSAHSDCSVASLSYAAQNNGGAGFTVAPNDTSDLNLDSALSMSAGAAQACQGAQITVYLKTGS